MCGTGLFGNESVIATCIVLLYGIIIIVYSIVVLSVDMHLLGFHFYSIARHVVFFRASKLFYSCVFVPVDILNKLSIDETLILFFVSSLFLLGCYNLLIIANCYLFRHHSIPLSCLSF